MDGLTTLLVFALGIATGLVNSISGGGGGLLSIPGLILFGLPANMAVATNQFGGLGHAVSSVYNFTKGKQIVLKYMFFLFHLAQLERLLGQKSC